MRYETYTKYDNNGCTLLHKIMSRSCRKHAVHFFSSSQKKKTLKTVEARS